MFLMEAGLHIYSQNLGFKDQNPGYLHIYSQNLGFKVET